MPTVTRRPEAMVEAEPMVSSPQAFPPAQLVRACSSAPRLMWGGALFRGAVQIRHDEVGDQQSMPEVFAGQALVSLPKSG